MAGITPLERNLTFLGSCGLFENPSPLHASHLFVVAVVAVVEDGFVVTVTGIVASAFAVNVTVRFWLVAENAFEPEHASYSPGQCSVRTAWCFSRLTGSGCVGTAMKVYGLSLFIL